VGSEVEADFGVDGSPTCVPDDLVEYVRTDVDEWNSKNGSAQQFPSLFTKLSRAFPQPSPLAVLSYADRGYRLLGVSGQQL
jgi:hypothetical protein